LGLGEERESKFNPTNQSKRETNKEQEREKERKRGVGEKREN
jgi:hypothetical protein